jgi:hypothetical protein
MADGRLQLLSTDVTIPPLTFAASWLASPDTMAVERVAELASEIARAGGFMEDAATTSEAAPRAKRLAAEPIG